RDRVLAHLSGVDTVARITGGSIVAADDITPSAFLAADWSHGGAIALAAGSPSSHVAMLARARGAPMVVGLGPLSWNGQPPALALVDGDAGSVIFDPEPETRRLFEQRMVAANAALAAAEAGGDKPIPGLTVDGESNPFLGLRGIRLSLARPEVFRVQLRALARAAVHGVLKVMLPMIAVPSELDRAGVMLDAEVAALKAEGI